MTIPEMKIRLTLDSKEYLAGVSAADAGTRRLLDSVSKGAVGAMQATQSLTASVARMGHVVAAAFTGRELAQAADSWASLSARVAIASDGLGNAAQAQAGLFAIAQRSRMGVEGLADSYVKLAGAGKEIGLSQADVLRTTETLAKAMTLGGGSAEGQKAALMQLGQALGSGALRGEELNSVLEQAPGLAKVLADSLGRPVGALKQMAEEGQLTSQVVVNALLTSSAAVDASFSRLPATIGQSLTQVNNAFLQTIGGFDKASGASQLVAGAMGVLSNNMGTALTAAAALTVGVGVLAKSAAAAALASRAVFAGIALLGGPVTVLAALLATGAAAWVAWKASGVDAEKAVEKQVVETDAEIIARIRGQIDAINERNKKAAAGIQDLPDSRIQESAAAYARTESRRQQAMAGSGEFAGLNTEGRLAVVASLTQQAGNAWSAYADITGIAAEKAAAAGDKLIASVAGAARTDADIRTKWVEDAKRINEAYQKVIDQAAGDPGRQRALEIDRAAKLKKLGEDASNAILKDARALATAQAAADLQRSQTAIEANKAALKADLADLDDYYTDKERLGEEYLTKKSELQRRELQADLALAQARQRAEAATPTDGTPATAVAKGSRLAGLQGVQEAAAAALQRNSGQAGRDLYEIKNKQINDAATADFNRRKQAVESAQQSLAGLVQATDEANVAMSSDDKERGERQIAMYRAQLEAQLQPLQTQPEKHAAAQQAINDAVASKAAELTERLKPEWQRQLEDWSNTAAQQARGMNAIIGTAMQEAENAFVQFAQTGKLSIKSLVNAVIAEFARMQFRQGMGSLMQMISGWGTGVSNGGGGNVGFGNANGGYARGGAFGPSGEIAFARGGIVNTPTSFKFAQGGALRNGLMGEAGPEAIMPLARDGQGRLGVRGGNESVYNIVVNGDATEATVRMIENAMAKYDRQRRRMGAFA